MAASSISLSPSTPALTFIFTPKIRSSLKPCNSSLQFSSSLFPPTTPHSKRIIFYPQRPQTISLKNTQIRSISATSGDIPTPDAPIESIQQTIAADEGGVSTIISGLLLIAFVGLSILTIGVIYIGVTDFLQKRQTDKFEKEEAAKKKKRSGKKGPVRARSGPRGFGQRIDEDDYDV